jgi:hypothetical protein
MSEMFIPLNLTFNTLKRYVLLTQCICFVNHVKYLGVIFDKMITWRWHTEMIEVKAFRTFIRAYS